MTQASDEAAYKTNLASLGTFWGFHIPNNVEMRRSFTAQEVVDWDQVTDGHVVFFPDGSEPLIHGIFSREAWGGDLSQIAMLLKYLGDDRTTTLLRIQYATRVLGWDLDCITVERLDKKRPLIFYGPTLVDVKVEAACALFKKVCPESYDLLRAVDENARQIFCGRYIAEEQWRAHEVFLDDQVVLMVKDW